LQVLHLGEYVAKMLAVLAALAMPGIAGDLLGRLSVASVNIAAMRWTQAS